MTEQPIAELTEIVGPANVLTDADAESLLVDWRNVHHGKALAVVRPGNTSEVAALMKWCDFNDVVVVTQGGNTGLSGGQIPKNERPTIVLSLQRMKQIETVDAEGWTMTVQAGVTIEAMQQAAAEVDRLFPPDWGARGSATIGGAIATDAGGNNVVRYGNMRDQIMGLEVVLADGEVWDGLRALRKDSSGYDLKQLFVGSEGTLGVVTRAVVKLHPATQYEQTALAALTGLDQLMDLFALTKEVAADEVVAFELMPENGMQRACELFDLTHPMPGAADFYALIKLASTRPITDQLTELLSSATTNGLITDAVVAATADQEKSLWTIREELPPARLYEHHGAGVKMDTAVPIEKMAEFHDTVRAIAIELVPDAVAYGFGHVGDGNLHMNVLPLADSQLETFKQVKPELMRRVDEATFALRGTLSAEHGVGRDLRDRIGAQKPDIEWKLMRSIKSAFDPNNRLNPGVLLPDE